MVEILTSPRALVLAGPGINREDATKTALEMAGGTADIVHLNQLKNLEVAADNYQIISIPGGFSYGDRIQAGRIMALEFQYNSVLSDMIYKHLEKGRFILGVCNGFQILVQSGLLPFGKIQPVCENVATLTTNVPPLFQSRWVYLKTQPSRCIFVDSEISPVTFPVAHGEGRFLTKNESIMSKLFKDNQIVFQYCTSGNCVTENYPDNPNGAVHAVAAICDPSGQILGMMPHPEDFVRRQNHPNWRRIPKDMPIDGLKFFERIVQAAKDL